MLVNLVNLKWFSSPTLTLKYISERFDENKGEQISPAWYRSRELFWSLGFPGLQCTFTLTSATCSWAQTYITYIQCVLIQTWHRTREEAQTYITYINIRCFLIQARKDYYDRTRCGRIIKIGKEMGGLWRWDKGWEDNEDRTREKGL